MSSVHDTITEAVKIHIADAIWDELEYQADRFGCVDRDQGIVDSGVDMDAVAARVLAALESRGFVVRKQVEP